MTNARIESAKAIMTLYRETFEGDDEIILLQLIGDLLEWCDAQKIDFQATVESAQEMLRDCAS